MPWYDRLGLDPAAVIAVVLVAAALDFLSVFLYVLQGDRARAPYSITPVSWVVPVIAVVMSREAVFLRGGSVLSSKSLLVLIITAYHIFCHAGVPAFRAKWSRRRREQATHTTEEGL